MPSDRWSPETLTTVIEYLESGMPICHVAEIKGMPSADTIERWENEGGEFAETIARARHRGMDKRAADIVRKAQNAEDAALGRLALDAERWYLSKMYSTRYGDKLSIGGASDLPPVRTIDAGPQLVAVLMQNGLSQVDALRALASVKALPGPNEDDA